MDALSAVSAVESEWQKWLVRGYLQGGCQRALGGRGTGWFHFFWVQFSRSILSDSLWRHGLQHTRLPCPSPTLRASSNPCPLSQWCHPTISSSVVPFSFCLQSFPASGSFLMSQFFASGGTMYWGFSISFSKVYSGLISSRIDWFDLLASQGTLKSVLNTTVQKHQFFSTQLFYGPTLTSIHDYWKYHSFD